MFGFMFVKLCTRYTYCSNENDQLLYITQMVSLIPESDYDGPQLPQFTIIKRFSFKYYDINLYKNELKVAQYLESHPHENVVKFLGLCDEWDANTIGDFTQTPGFIYEYGFKYDRLGLGRFVTRRESQRIESMKQMINGIKHIHENNIVHGRVVERDFILCKNSTNGQPCIKLGGFDHSKLFKIDSNDNDKGMYTVQLCTFDWVLFV